MRQFDYSSLSPTHGLVRAQPECPPSRRADSLIGDVLTASIAQLFTLGIQGIRYAYADCVLLTIHLGEHLLG